jgi:integrase
MQERRLKAQEIAPTHLRNVQTYVFQRFIPFFGSEDIREIRKKRILEFKECLGDQLSLKTVRNILSCLHSMFAFWVDVEMLEKMPRFPGIRILDPESWSWADEETQLKILSKVPDRDRPIFYFTCFQGVRPSESRAVQWRDLNLREGTVRIRRTWSKSELRLPKGKRERILPLDPEVQSMIEKMQRPLDPEAFVFQRNGRHYSESYCRKLWNFMMAQDTPWLASTCRMVGR